MVTGARCGNGQREGSEQCDRSDDSDATEDINRNGIADGNEDACNNDCTLARCGDGFDQGKVCSGNTVSSGRACATDAQCGSGGRCADSEECDLGDGNGTPCDPRYNGTCTFCDTQCNAVTVSGGFCGDTVWQRSEEQCDGADGLAAAASGALPWVCLGSVGVNEWFWNFSAGREGWTLPGTASPTTTVDDVLQRVSPGYQSQSALRIKAFGSQEDVVTVFPDTNGKTYVVSAWVNTRQTDPNLDSRRFKLGFRRQNRSTFNALSPDWIALDRSSDTWQYAELQVVFDSGSDRALNGVLVVRVDNRGDDSINDEILVDQVHLRPVVVATCSGNTCQAACATGVPCHNTGGNFDSDAIVDACDNDMDNDGVPNNLDCVPRDRRRGPDVAEICPNGIDDNCEGRIDEGC